MTYQQAVGKLEQFEHLVGQQFDKKKVSNLAIVPSNRKEDGEIIGRLILNRPYGDILSRYSDFEIIVVFDIGKSVMGTGSKGIDDLDNFLDKFHLH